MGEFGFNHASETEMQKLLTEPGTPKATDIRTDDSDEDVPRGCSNEHLSNFIEPPSPQSSPKQSRRSSPSSPLLKSSASSPRGSPSQASSPRGSPEQGANTDYERSVCSGRPRNEGRRRGKVNRRTMTVQDAQIWVQTVIEFLESESKNSMTVSDGKCDRTVERICPGTFAALRTELDVDRKYIKDITKGTLQDAPAWMKPSPNWVTENGKFIIQPLCSTAADWLNDFCVVLRKYLRQNSNSFVGKYVGLYNVGKPVIDNCNFVAVMKNEFPWCKNMDYMYSINGTNPNLFTPRTGNQNQVLTEGNFEQEQTFMLISPDTHDAVTTIIRRDVAMLKEEGAMDYSMVLGILKLKDPSQHNGWSKEPAVGAAKGFHGWRIDEEPVLYYPYIVCYVQASRGSGMVKSVIRGKNVTLPQRYQESFLQYVLSHLRAVEKDTLKWQCTKGSKQRYRNIRDKVNTLALVAAADLEDELKLAEFDEIMRWCAMVDVLEAGHFAIGLWRQLGVEPMLSKVIDVFKADLCRMPLPPFTGAEDRYKAAPKAAGGFSGMDQMLASIAKVRKINMLKGALCQPTSTLHSLALAISVGIEAATRASARISARSKPVYTRFPQLRRRAAATYAKRKFFLPEGGSWLSSPHMLPDLAFVEYAPEIFSDIRAGLGLSDDEYMDCVCPREFYFIQFTTNSKSGSLFFFTHDRKCMVKTISDCEARTLQNLIHNGYVEHFESNEGSLLTRILGLYQVQLPWFNGGKATHFVVQENLLYNVGQELVYRFDLKGSTKNRKAKPGESVFKDLDWIEKKHSFNYDCALGPRIQESHRRDCEFLAKCGVVDYSVFVIECKAPQLRRTDSGKEITSPRTGKDLWHRVRNAHRFSFYGESTKPLKSAEAHGPHQSGPKAITHLGIIDYLIPWDWKKKLEFAWRTCQFQCLRTSINPPGWYAKRQVEFLNDCWEAST